MIEASQANTISPHMDWVTPEAVREAHDLGVRVVPYTANSEADWSYLISCGVDGIITDDPQALIHYLRNQSLRKSAFEIRSGSVQKQKRPNA